MKKEAKQNLLCILLLFNSCSFLYATDNLRVADARNMGMGGNGVTGTALFNPALIALYEKKSIRLNYYNPYGLKELANINGSLYIHNHVLPIGVDIQSFGYDVFRESMFRLLMGKRLNEQWILGVSFQYALLQTELLEEKAGRISTDLGIGFQPVENLLIGMLIMNFPSVSLGDKSINIEDFGAYRLQIGLRWKIINNLFISGTLENNEQHAVTANAGIEYEPFTDFSLRIGIKDKPLNPSFGVGYAFMMFRVDMAVIYHTVLGVSIGAGVMFSF